MPERRLRQRLLQDVVYKQISADRDSDHEIKFFVLLARQFLQLLAYYVPEECT